MRRWTILAALVAMLGIFGAGSLRAPTVASSQSGRTWDVLVGPELDEEQPPIEIISFLPNALSINVGDTVNFQFLGFHTVTFLGLGTEAIPANTVNLTSFPGNEAALPIAIPGTEAGTVLINPQAAFPSVPPGTMNVTYNGTGFLNSGVPQEPEGDEGEGPPPPFAVTFTAAGNYTYLCLVHPGMVARLAVEPAGAALPETPAQATARGEAQLRALVAAIRTEAQNVRFAQPVSAEAPGRATVHTALAGLSNIAGVSLLAFLPERLTIRRGDIIVWTMPDPANFHTVTFVSGANPPAFVEPQFGPGGPGAGPPMLVIPASVANPTGGTTYTGTGYVNSGILLNAQSFALRFDAPAGSYEYLCLVHPFMRGTVMVNEP